MNNFLTEISVSCFHGNEIVGHLTKKVELPFSPYVGLRIAFPLTCGAESVESFARLSSLMTNCGDPTAILKVESILFRLSEVGTGSFSVDSRAFVSNELMQVKQYMEFMAEFHGFEAEYV